MIIAIKAPRAASGSDTKAKPAKNAKKKPAADPSRLLSLLKGRDVRAKNLPKIEAVLSPRAKIAMAAALAGAGKIRRVSRMPTAKYTGASTT